MTLTFSISHTICGVVLHLASGFILGVKSYFERIFSNPRKDPGHWCASERQEKGRLLAWQTSLNVLSALQKEGRRGQERRAAGPWMKPENYMWWALPEGRQAEKVELPAWTWFLVGIMTTLGSPWLPALSSKCFLQVSSKGHMMQVWKCWGTLENMKK